MKQLKDISTIKLLELCKGNWPMAIAVPDDLIVQELENWGEEVKAVVIKGLKAELNRRSANEG